MFRHGRAPARADPSAITCPALTAPTAGSQRAVAACRRGHRSRVAPACRNPAAGASQLGLVGPREPCEAFLAMPPAPAPGEVPYTEIAPPPDLAPYVDRLWLRTTVGGAGRIHRVLPDGCVDIIVDAARGAAQLVGTMTRAIEVADGPSQIIAVRFRPGTAGALVGAPLAELTDRATRSEERRV